MKQALEALKDFGNHRHDCPQWPTYTEPEKYPACDCGYDKAITSIDQAIARAEHLEAEKQEPYGYLKLSNGKFYHEVEGVLDLACNPDYLPLHTHPQPKREWVELTDEQVEKIIKANMSLQMNLAGIRQDFEAAHGIKE